MITWTQEAQAVTLQSISLPLGHTAANASAIRIPCSTCVPQTPGKGDNVGGDLFVQFRDDQGYSGLNLETKYQKKVYVHLLRKLSKYNNQYGAKNGKGSELWAMLNPGETWSRADLGVAIHVCEIRGDVVGVSVADTELTAAQQCSNFG